MSAPSGAESWSASQLIEYLAVLAEQPDEAHALRAALERALETLDADIGVLSGGNIPTRVVVGLPAGDSRLDELVGDVRDGADSVEIDGFGSCRAAVVALDVEPDPTRFLVIRTRTDDFLPGEVLVLHGMAWVLDLVLRQLQLVSALNERQRVSEQVARVQRAIAGRVPLPEVLDTVTSGALSLFGSDHATLQLVDKGELGVVSVSTSSDDPLAAAWAWRLSAAVGEDAFRHDAFVQTDEASAGLALPAELDTHGAGSAMGAPVRENGKVVGSLVVVSLRKGYTFSSTQRQSLLTFADQVSVALSDAKTLATAQQAFHDDVTGLPNRLQFLERLERALARGHRVNVFFIDLDRFKSVNDTLGHAAGNELLQQVGTRLQGCLPAGSCLARIGGDEFAALVENGSAATVKRVGRSMLAAARQPYELGQETVRIGLSIGVAAGQHPSATGEILHDADTAMYQSKRRGGERLTRSSAPV